MAALDEHLPTQDDLLEALRLEAIAASAHKRCSTIEGHCSYRRHALAVADDLLDDLLAARRG